MGYRYRVHVRRLPGCPDIVLPRLKSIVFVHGCFWHRHNKCPFAYSPKTNKVFWEKKFDGNVRRDQQHLRDLVELGWRVLVVWECEINDLRLLSDRLRSFLSNV
jgi:DNA mismatch endonuclease, patch repair protein